MENTERLKRIILLDLNYTLVGNSIANKFTSPYQRKIKNEEYREWLVSIIRNEHVILITARPDYQKELTMQNIQEKLKWQPTESYYNELNQQPPECKERILNEYIFPKHGEEGDGVHYFGLESNPRTKKMYSKYQIPAVTVRNDKEDADLVERAINDIKLQRTLLKNIKTGKIS